MIFDNITRPGTSKKKINQKKILDYKEQNNNYFIIIEKQKNTVIDNRYRFDMPSAAAPPRTEIAGTTHDMLGLHQTTLSSVRLAVLPSAPTASTEPPVQQSLILLAPTATATLLTPSTKATIHLGRLSTTTKTREKTKPAHDLQGIQTKRITDEQHTDDTEILEDDDDDEILFWRQSGSSRRPRSN